MIDKRTHKVEDIFRLLRRLEPGKGEAPPFAQVNGLLKGASEGGVGVQGPRL